MEVNSFSEYIQDNFTKNCYIHFEYIKGYVKYNRHAINDDGKLFTSLIYEFDIKGKLYVINLYGIYVDQDEFCKYKKIVNEIISKINNSFKELEVAYIFGLIVFYNNDYIQFKQPQKNIFGEIIFVVNKKIKRFFDINKKLPIEIQMLICNFVFNSKKVFVLNEHSIKMFKLLNNNFFWNCVSIDKSSFFKDIEFVPDY
jgi:hypothetical protein